MYVFGDEVAWVMRSAAARGEVADLASARKGAKALSATDCSMLTCFRASGEGVLVFRSARETTRS